MLIVLEFEPVMPVRDELVQRVTTDIQNTTLGVYDRLREDLKG